MDTKFFTESIVAAPSGLKINNLLGTEAQLFELKGPYMAIQETFDFSNDKINIVNTAPGLYASQQYKLSESGMLKDRPLHRHDFVEIMFVLSGTVIQMIEQQEYVYHAGQCCLMNHNIRHVEVPNEDTSLFFLMLSSDFLTHLVTNDLHFDQDGNRKAHDNAIYRFIEESLHSDAYKKNYWDFQPLLAPSVLINELSEIFDHIISETKNLHPGFFLMIQALIARLFGLLVDPSRYMVRRINPVIRKNERLFIEIQQILEEQHGRISRDKLSSELNYEEHHLNNIVKKMTGMSLLSYARIFCLKEAARRLVDTQDSVSTIIDDLGFSNRSHFYRIFSAQYGLTPKEYRNRYQHVLERN